MNQEKQPPKKPLEIIPPTPVPLESSFDPQGSYTGNPQGGGPQEKPVQDADDL